MAVSPRRKVAVLAFGILVAWALVLASASPVAATQNAPAWSTGDSWTWTWTSGSTTYTQTWTVRDQSSLSLPSGSNNVWHVNETVTATTSSGSTTSWSDWWIVAGTLSWAKHAIGAQITFTWDPPYAQAVFPLNGNSWTLTTTRTRVIGPFTSTNTFTYTGTALAETNLQVPAGTFHVTPVQSPSSGTSYQLAYYADSVGNFVRIEQWQNGQLTSSQSLTSYKYQAAALGLFAIAMGGIVGLAAIAIVVLYLLRRRPRYPMRAPAYPRAGVPPEPPREPPLPPPGT